MRLHRQLSALFLAFALAVIAPMASAAPEKENKVVIGQVGQVLKKAKVHTKADPRSRAYFSVNADEYIVVKVDAPKGWTKVLLSNGKYGYIDAQAIDPLDFEVTADAPVRSTAVASRGGSPRGTTGLREAAAEKGLDFLGTRYVWGGNDIEGGIDCSGFVQQLYGNFGVNMPRTAAEQAMVGKSINKLEDLEKGDRLYFWDSKRGKIGHTGLYLGGGRFVHSSSSRGGVAVDDLREGKWRRILVAARR